MMADDDGDDEGRLFPDIGSVRQIDRPIRVRFANFCPFPVDLFWMNDKKEPTKYGRLGHKQYLDIQTFEKHPWVARRAFDGLKVQMNKKPIYWPQPIVRNNQARSVVVRTNIQITFKVQSLRDIAARSLLHHPDIIRTQIHLLPADLQMHLQRVIAKHCEYSSHVCQEHTVRPLLRQRDRNL